MQFNQIVPTACSFNNREQSNTASTVKPKISELIEVMEFFIEANCEKFQDKPKN